MPAHYHQDLIAAVNGGYPEAAGRACDEAMRRMADYPDCVERDGEPLRALAR